MADNRIVTDTAQLRELAESVSSKLGVIESDFNTIMSTIASSASYWEGEAADVYRAKLASREPKVQSFINRVEEYIDDLGSISTVYETAEKASSQVSADLDVDVIY